MEREEKMIVIDNRAKLDTLPLLVDLLKATGEGVGSIELRSCYNRRREYDVAVVHFSNGYQRSVNISGDGPLAMCVDIIKEISTC